MRTVTGSDREHDRAMHIAGCVKLQPLLIIQRPCRLLVEFTGAAEPRRRGVALLLVELRYCYDHAKDTAAGFANVRLRS